MKVLMEELAQKQCTNKNYTEVSMAIFKRKKKQGSRNYLSKTDT